MFKTKIKFFMFIISLSSKEITLSWMMTEMYLFFKMVEIVEIQSYRNSVV